MKLTENEIREVIKLIEQGKPLPDEYRFKLFDDSREVELIWNGKTNEVESAVLPFQTIEHVDEPRSEESKSSQSALFEVDDKGRQISDWTNKLVWGDNKYILSSLKNGPLREEIERNGGIKLIYIDPPFDVGADFSMDIEIGGETLVKEPSVLEEIAYRDTWGKGADSFIAMIYERLSLMKDLLAEDGSIYVHCDWRVSSYLKLILDDLFGNYRAEIAWQKLRSAKSQSGHFANLKDSIFVYTKSAEAIFNPIYVEKDEKLLKTHYRHEDPVTGKRYNLADFTQTGSGPSRNFGDKALSPPAGKHWIWSQERIDEGIKDGLIVFSKTGKPYVKRYFDDTEGSRVGDLWDDINPVNQVAKERLDYPTQKPEALCERIISASSNEGDIVADFFMGSGTVLSVAEKMGRKWIGSDLGKFSIHTARKRLINVQRQLKSEGKNYRAFEILNLGKYQRQYLLTTDNAGEQMEAYAVRQKKEKDYVELILGAYKAEIIGGFSGLSGQKAGRFVAVGPINMPVTKDYLMPILDDALKNSITKIDVLAFEYEMGLTPYIQEESKTKGIDLALKIIPPDVFDKRAVEKNQVKFYDVAYIEVKPHQEKQSIAIELIDFSVFYNQDTDEADLKSGQTKIVIRDGQVVKLNKDKNSDIVSSEILTKEWTDWIDYWSVDFNFESRKEIIHVFKKDVVKQRLFGEPDPTQLSMENIEEKWTGNYIFENEWQDFRTKKKRELELKTPLHEYAKPGKKKIAIKVVDIFGNDTMKVIEVTI